MLPHDSSPSSLSPHDGGCMWRGGRNDGPSDPMGWMAWKQEAHLDAGHVRQRCGELEGCDWDDWEAVEA